MSVESVMLSNHLISLIFLLIPSKCSWTKQLEHESWSFGQFVSGLFGISVLFWGSLFPAFGTSHMLNMLLWAGRLKPPPSRLKAQVTPRLRTSRNLKLPGISDGGMGLWPGQAQRASAVPGACSAYSVHQNLARNNSAVSTKTPWVVLNSRHHCYCSIAQGVLLFATPWTVKLQPSLSFTIFWSLLKFISIELVMPGIMGEKRCSWEWLKPPSWAGS